MEPFDVEQFPITKENVGLAVSSMMTEHEKAIEKFPVWPISIYAGLTIAAEEAGETAKAALDYQFKSGSLDDVIEEAAQTAAMYIRVLQHLYAIKNGDLD